MTRPAWASSVGAEFDAFLYAPIGEEKHGMLLSVLSALARLNIDPWEEAAKLARLPEETATQILAARIAALPDGSSPRSDPGITAARLVALLPRRAGGDPRPARNSSGGTLMSHAPTVRSALFYVIVILVLMAAQWLNASRQAPTTSTVSPNQSQEGRGRG
jgi:hypothetical protein